MTPSRDGLRLETRVAIDAVEQGLELARRRVGAEDITFKGARDAVTATDVAVEDAVRAIVRGALASPVIGEERGGAPPADGSPYWLGQPTRATPHLPSALPPDC